MAKVHAIYDTNDKSLTVTHDTNGKDEPHENVKHLEFHQIGQSKAGAGEYQMACHMVEKDDAHDMVNVHRIHANKYEEQKVGEKVQKFLQDFEDRKIPKVVKKSANI